MTSKSYRAVLPNLGEEELQRLRRWAEDNCSASSVFHGRLPAPWALADPAEACAIVPISLARDAAHAVQDTPTPRQDPVSEPEADGAKIISLGRSSAPTRLCLHVLKD